MALAYPTSKFDVKPPSPPCEKAPSVAAATLSPYSCSAGPFPAPAISKVNTVALAVLEISVLRQTAASLDF